MIRKVLTLAFLVALAASPAFAYVPPGNMTLPDEVGGRRVHPQKEFEITPMGSETAPVKPVPEPGTIAMASMGLMALGVHLRRRRGN